MRSRFAPYPLSLLLLAAPATVPATDVDGPDDCVRILNDRGDAPEGFDAYPGVPGRFPTCIAATPAGTQEAACPPISVSPGPTGFVLHVNPEQERGFWLGCSDDAAPMGIDSEPDGKTSPGGPLSACNEIPVDCVETTSIGDFGQDECFGDDDAGLMEMPTLVPCSPATLKLRTYNCDEPKDVYLNVLIDMNQDGDWNDNFQCPSVCTFEWALKNVPVPLDSGCKTWTTPPFLVGPFDGVGWMRISLSEVPVPDDFPWNGSVSMPSAQIPRGETEDYLVSIGSPDPCDVGYHDFGDAPEGITAYSNGNVGHFPTCTTASAPGTQELDAGCAPLSLPPGPTGYVEHVKAPGVDGFWWGCDGTGALFVDSEPDGKVNVTPPAGTPSACNNLTPTDCLSTTMIPGLSFGQDECFGDGVDAGLLGPPLFESCVPRPLRFRIFNCSLEPTQAYVNLLFDWNEDGDWNDVSYCDEVGACAPEWAIRNLPVMLDPGCQVWISPLVLPGRHEGEGWMRATLTPAPVPDDFPWAGSAGANEIPFQNGETEDYPIRVGADPTGVRLGQLDEISGITLSRIAPTPSVTHADVAFSLTRAGRVRLTAYDVTGRRVRTLLDGSRPAGAHRERWDLRGDDGSDVAPGIYLVRLEAEGDTRTTKVTRVR
jgi:hypothetical protein